MRYRFRKSKLLRITKTRQPKLVLLLLLVGGGLLLSLALIFPNGTTSADSTNPGDANFTMDATTVPGCAGQSECFAFHVDTRLNSNGATSGTSTTFSIPTSSIINGMDSYDWVINWGDGSGEQTVSGTGSILNSSINHDYVSSGGAGQYQIAIRPNGAPADGWFNAFGFSDSSYDANTSANKYKFRSIDTPFTNMMRTQSPSSRFEQVFFGAVNALGIPTGLFVNVNVAGVADLSRMFDDTFAGFASNSTTAFIPAGLFDSIDTSGATKFTNMFDYTFAGYANRSTAATIPAGLFDSIDTSNATNLENMFYGTFTSYAERSTVGTIPAGLFDSVNTSGVTDMDNMFNNTFSYYANRSTVGTIPDGLFNAINSSSADDLRFFFNYTFRSYAGSSTVGTIPAGLFDAIDVSSSSSLDSMFMATFEYYAERSTAGTIPAGLFDSVKTDQAVNTGYMFMYTFLSYAKDSTVGTIPAGLFDSIKTNNAISMSDMFASTFNTYAQNSTVGTIPAGLFNSINTSKANYILGMFYRTFGNYANNNADATVPDNLFSSLRVKSTTGGMFEYTLDSYGHRSARFVVGNSVVDTQTFSNPYSVKIGTNGTPDNNPSISTSSVVYPTYNATTRTINAPTGAYAGWTWYTTDGTDCAVADPTPDCGAQDSSAIAVFPNSAEWVPATSTEKGNVTFYSFSLPPTVIAVDPDEGPTDTADIVVTITGTNFIDVVDVTVGEEDCVSFTVESDAEISCTLPIFTAVGGKSVLVTNDYGTNEDNELYTVILKPPAPTPPNPEVPTGFVPGVPNSGKKCT